MFARTSRSITDTFLSLAMLAVLGIALLYPLGGAIAKVVSQIDIASGEVAEAEVMEYRYVVNDNSHGAEKHPESYALALECFANPNAKLYTAFVMDGKHNRKLFICNLDLDFYFRAWVIEEGSNDPTGNTTTFGERTAYLKQEIHNLDDLTAFAKRRDLRLMRGLIDAFPK